MPSIPQDPLLEEISPVVHDRGKPRRQASIQDRESKPSNSIVPQTPINQVRQTIKPNDPYLPSQMTALSPDLGY